VVTIILLGLLLVMLIAAALLILKSGESPAPAPPPLRVTQTNPFVPGRSGPAMAGIPLQSPVVFLLDSSSGMQSMFDYAVGIVEASLKSLGPGDRFGITVSAEGGDRLLPGGYSTGSAESRRAAEDFLLSVMPGGASDLPRSLAASLALDPSPRTIVLLARRPAEDLLPAAEEARRKGIRIVTVALDATGSVAAGMESLADATGGQALHYDFADLQRLVRESHGAGAEHP